MRARLLLAIVCTFGAARPARAQVPDTDIWLSALTVDGDSIWIGPPRNLTQRPGYDNQPCFLGTSRAFLFVSADSKARTDVFRYDLGTASITRVTATPESEYSPTPLGTPERGFCAVRVEADSTQRLWRFDLDGSHAAPVMSDVDSVGYFSWMDERTVAVFVVGRPHTLRVVDVPTQRESIVARDIGRSILEVPGGRGTSFLAASGAGHYRFFVLPSPTRAPVALIDAVGEAQDAAWLGDTLFMASGSRVFASRPFSGAGWRPIADLSGAGLGGITRLAITPDHRWIALVATGLH